MMIDNLMYFDTNVYSTLASIMDLVDVANLRKRLLSKGKRPVPSPVNILEILATKNEKFREDIIIVCQHLCEPEILAEPEALIIDYIASYAPRPETSHLVLKNQFGISDLARTWKDVRADKDRTLLLSREDLQRIEVLKTLHGYFHVYYSRGKRMPDLLLPEFIGEESINECIADAARELRKERAPNNRMAILCENRILMTLTILCAGLSPFPYAIDSYWTAIGIDRVDERFAYAKKELSFLQDAGPIIGLGTYMGWQATKGLDRGNFYDCMHFMYLPYVDMFVTDDLSFHDFTKEYPESRILDRIVTSDALP
ncbi:MAG: hypothetical protein QME44_07865 [Thermodesulfobacteriota bacterium]|nr:hypothetical protein [Thermodesulfobacteriota bacterium]